MGTEPLLLQVPMICGAVGARKMAVGTYSRRWIRVWPGAGQKRWWANRLGAPQVPSHMCTPVRCVLAAGWQEHSEDSEWIDAAVTVTRVESCVARTQVSLLCDSCVCEIAPSDRALRLGDRRQTCHRYLRTSGLLRTRSLSLVDPRHGVVAGCRSLLTL